MPPSTILNTKDHTQFHPGLYPPARLRVQQRRRSRGGTLTLLLAVLGLATAKAGTILWTNTSGGNWSTPANWSPNQQPAASDDVVITTNGSYTVTLDIDTSIGSLSLGGAAGQQALGAGSHALTISGAGIINANGLLISGGTLSYGGLFTVNGTLNWTGGVLGTVGAALNVGPGGLLSVSGGTVGQDRSSYGALTNAGTVIWSGVGNWQAKNYANFYNLSGGLFDIQTDQTLASSPGAIFDNGGTVRKSVGSSSSWASTSFYFNNHGNVEVLNGGLFFGGLVTNIGAMSALSPIVPPLDGTIAFNAGGFIGGEFFATNGAGFNLNGGAWTLTDPVFSGSGQYKFNGQSLTLTSDVISNLTLAGGYLYLSDTFQGGSITNLTLSGSALLGTNVVTGTLNWTGGYIGFQSLGGALTIASNGVMNASGSATKYLQGAFTNAGVVHWSGGNWQSSGQAALWNLAGGLFDIQSDQSMSAGQIQFFNAGLLRKSAGSASTVFGNQVNNSGTVAVLSGTLVFPNPFTNSGALEADAGTISLQGPYSGMPSAALAFSLGGPSLTTNYGQIQFTSPLALSGTLNVMTRNGYLPNAGDLFHVLTYPSATGSFTCMNLDLGQGILLQPRFRSTSLDLLATSYDTNSTRPTLSISRGLGTNLFVTWPAGFPNWTLQTSTNLAAPFWAPVPACGSQAAVPVAAPQQYFRLAGPSQ
jgi:hypothetical protein